MDVQWQYKRGQGVIYVMCHYGMAVWGRGLHQELWYVVNDITINDVPKFLMNTPTPYSHYIVAHDINNPLTPLVLTLYIHGVTSWLPVSKTSLEDWNYMKYQTIKLTAEKLDWETNDTRFQESEEAMTSYGDQLMGKYDNEKHWLSVQWPHWQYHLLILQVTTTLVP